MKKNNNKGFMLLETMVVSAFIITTLIFLYIQFSNLQKSYINSFKYDPIPELFKTKEIDKFINENYGYDSLLEGVQNSEHKYIELYDGSVCNLTYFSKYNIDCNRLMREINAKTVLLVSTNLSSTINYLKSSKKYSNGLYLYMKRINQSTNNRSYSLIVEYEDNKYTNLIINDENIVVTFDPNGGTVSKEFKEIPAEQEKYGTLPTPIRDGYTFKGWSLSERKDGYEIIQSISKNTKYNSLGEYINTGITVNSNNYNKIRFVLDEMINENGTGWYISGSANNGYNAVYVGIATTGHNFYYGVGNDSSSNVTASDITKRYIYDLNIKDKTYRVTDFETKTELVNMEITLGTGFNSTGLPLYLMGYSGENRGYAGKFFGAKIYIDDVLTRDFVPCVRLSDNAIGVLDNVNNTFYANSGSGSFIADYGFVDENTVISTAGNHTLTAIWEENN